VSPLHACILEMDRGGVPPFRPTKGRKRMCVEGLADDLRRAVDDDAAPAARAIRDTHIELLLRIEKWAISRHPHIAKRVQSRLIALSWPVSRCLRQDRAP
jgi:hypothetical protein